jgi:hypothetical protein
MELPAAGRQKYYFSYTFCLEANNKLEMKLEKKLEGDF